MQVETVCTSPEPITASKPQDNQKSGWTCVNWYNTVFEIAARKTSRIFGHVVAGFVSVFTFIPSLTVDLSHAVIKLYDRKISRPETPVKHQMSAAVLPASVVSSDKSAHSMQSSVEPTPVQKQVPSRDLSTSGFANNPDNVRPLSSSSEEAQKATARLMGFGSSVNKSPLAGSGSTGSASDTASELPQGRNIHQLEVPAAKPQTSEQKRREVFKKNLINFDRLLNNLVDEVYSVVQIPTYAQAVAEQLVQDEQRYRDSPDSLIKDLRSWNQLLKFELESRYFESSQPITSEFATQTLKVFRTRLEKLLSTPDLASKLKGFSGGIAAMLPECRTNCLALENPLCLAAAEDKVIATAKRLRKLINEGGESLALLLWVTPGNRANINLKNELDECIQNILFMQGTKEARITEVQV